LCEAAQVAAFGGLALTLSAGTASFSALVLLALVNGVATAVALASGEALIPALVPEERLSGAVALNSARTFAGQLAGTSAGGFRPETARDAVISTSFTARVLPAVIA
jgi:MFS family permease